MASLTKLPIQTGSRNPALKELDPSTAFLYAPRTLTALGLGIFVLAYASNVFGTGFPAKWDIDPVSNTKVGIWGAIAVFLGYSLVQGPETSMVRPHPAFWRLVHGSLLVYLMLLIWLLFQNIDDARLFMKHLHPALGVPVVYRSYANDCRLWVAGKGWNWRTLHETIIDEFVVAHTLGWWGKALVARNWVMLWLGSIGFELVELSFAHMLPNFNECWWDSWLLDVALCNLLGISLGMQTVRWMESNYANYNWQGISQLPSLPAKARRSLMQLGPYSWDRFNWMLFDSPTRLMQSLAVVALMLNVEVNAFFLKYLLWVPPTNPLNTIRLLLWFLAVLPGVREWYLYIDGRSKALDLFPKVGPFAWLAIALNAVETLISIKFSRGQFHAPWPRTVVAAWGLGAGMLAAGTMGWQLLLWLHPLRAQQEGEAQLPLEGPEAQAHQDSDSCMEGTRQRNPDGNKPKAGQAVRRRR